MRLMNGQTAKIKTGSFIKLKHSSRKHTARILNIKQSGIFKNAAFIFSGVLFFLIGLILEINLVVPVFLLSLALYVKTSHPNISSKNYNFLNLGLLFTIIFAASFFILKHKWPVFYIPFSLIPMLSSILFGELGISLLISLASSLSIASLAGNDYSLGMLSLTSSICAVILAQGIRRRDEVIGAGFIIGLLQAATLFFIARFNVNNWPDYLILVFNGIASSIIVVGVLPIFEYIFRTITDISLLELFNHPLLEKMKLEAAGTYHHSIMVGNLAETAACAIGAKALLSRLGAYYHDIGKIEKAGYFSENQEMDANKHDALSPALSKLIIMNHVKEGVELAKKYRLNPFLIDFIQQHHGNSLVYYFYRRALESLEDDQNVKEEGFRYPGPKPNTKETAIVLLADSVEAAARALKNPNPAKIEEIVHKVINNKFIDGQLDECNLTLKDLEDISSIFIRILSGAYHSRVTYPEESRSEHNHKRFSKKNPHLAHKDKKGNS